MQRFLASLAIMLAVLMTKTVAHHSIAMFDNLNPTTLTGTVKEFIWINPHGRLVIDVKERRNGKGEVESTTPEEWSVELHSTGIMLRRGWTRTFFKPGDTITVTGGRMVDGTKMIRLVNGVKADGTKFYGDDFRPEATGNNLPSSK
jgi:hypothetical protein